MNDKPAILIAEDDAEMRMLLADVMRDEGYDVLAAEDGEHARRMVLDGRQVDLVITDVRMRALDGLALLDVVRAMDATIPVVVITAFGTIQLAVEAMRRGACQFLTKPFPNADLVAVVRNALGQRASPHRAANAGNGPRDGLGLLVGRSPAMQELYDTIERVAPIASSVLVRGESGTGKEVVARTIHEMGPRRSRAFVPVACTAIPEGLLESELFGHTRGSFTGAVAARRGLFVQADGGTLFLDEVGDLPIGLQAKLLRVLQDHLVRPVGSNDADHVDVRIIAATHRDLESRVRAGTFREDLYYRLVVVPIRVPPLRARDGDVVLLAEHFLERLARAARRPPKRLQPDAVRRLDAHRWPGNVRELENFAERMAVLVREDVIDPEHVDRLLDGGTALHAPAEGMTTLDDLERRYIEDVLRLAGGNRDRAAAILGIDRRTLYRRIRRWRDEAEDADDDVAPEEGDRRQPN